MSSELMTFSVVIPTYNRPVALTACLAALARMDYPRDRFEVVVVDDGSHRDLSPVFRLFNKVIDLKFHRQSNAGPAAARNTGANGASNEFIAFIDDDCRAHRNWLRQLAGALSPDLNVMVGGVCNNALPWNLCAQASQTLLHVMHGHFNRDHQNAVFFPSDNMSMSRKRFLDLGGFDATFRHAEDRDLCDRWLARGWRMVFAPDAVVDHAREMGLRGFCRQHFGYGRGASRYHWTRRQRGAGRLEIDGGFYARCVGQPLATEPLLRSLPLVSLLFLAQMQNALGFFSESTSRKVFKASSARSGRREAALESPTRSPILEEAPAKE